MLGCLVFCFGFSRQFSQVFHHGVGIDLPDGADLALEFTLTLELALAFQLTFELAFQFTLTEKAADDVSDGTQPALAFQACFTFAFEFEFPLEFTFQLVFELIQRRCHVHSFLRDSFVSLHLPGSRPAAA